MLSNPLTWTILAPLLGCAVAALFLLAQNRKKTPSRYVPWLRLAAFLSTVAGLIAEIILLLASSGSITYFQLGITLAIYTPSRLVLVAANLSLLCAAVTAWMAEDEAHSPDHEWGLLAATLSSCLLAGAGLASDRLVAALCLFGAALVASALALARPRNPLQRIEGNEQNLLARALLARRLAGGLKHLGLAALGTGLLLVGAVLAARYTFNLENRALLQLGLALLAAGTVVRAGAMPFAAASADTVDATPSAALIMLGAGTPVALVAGLLMLAPVEGSLAGGAAAPWLGAISVLLAGVRALGGGRESNQTAGTPYPTLAAMTVAVATGWAIFGILSGSQTGAVGAVLIAGNIAISLPILIMGRSWTLVGVASLLGLPPLGGFAGTLLVAQSAASAGGIWLAILLTGSALTAASWLRIFSPGSWSLRPASTNGANKSRGRLAWLTNPAYLLPALLSLLQLLAFVVSPLLVSQLSDWARVPWLVGP